MNKKLLAAAISGALAAPLAAQAVDFKISGHVHRGIRWLDDGVGSDVQHIDPSTSRSRFRFRGSEDFGNGMTAGIYVETGLASNVGSKVPLKGGDGFDTAFDIRHSALFFSGGWGAVWLGHTSHAADGVLFSGFNASGLADTPTLPLTDAGAVAFRTSGGASTGITAGSAFASYDGARTDTLRYDSPKLGPAEFKVSIGNDQHWEAAAFLDGALGGGKYQLKAGLVDQENKAGFDQWTVTGAYLFAQGTNVQAGYGERDFVAGRTGEQIYFGIGHNWGNNGVSISWGESSDHVAAGVDATNWGIGFNHKIPQPGIDVYALYRNMELDGIANVEDMNMFLLGTRIQFQ